MPHIQLKNIDSKKKCALPGEVAEKVIAAVLENIGPAIEAIGANKYFDKGIEAIGKKVKEAVGKKLGESVEDKAMEVHDVLKISLASSL